MNEHQLWNEGLSKVEQFELYSLIIEIEQLEFDTTSQLSNHIAKNKLGFKYPHISGVVTMKKQSTTWNFKGGFPPKIYRIICTALRLSRQVANAKLINFRSYASMKSYV